MVLVASRTSNRERQRLKGLHENEFGVDDGKRRLPLTWGDCQRNIPVVVDEKGNRRRMCPHVGCRHHLFLDVLENGNIRVAFRDRDPDEIPVACSLDFVADGVARKLDEVGHVLGLTRERVRQIEESARRKYRRALYLAGIGADGDAEDDEDDPEEDLDLSTDGFELPEDSPESEPESEPSEPPSEPTPSEPKRDA